MSEQFYLTPEKERDWRRRRYWRLKEKGVCTCCGQVRSDGTNLCARCKETQRRSHEILRQDRIKNNLCRRCGAPLPDTRYTHCLKCRLDASERVKKAYWRKKEEKEAQR